MLLPSKYWPHSLPLRGTEWLTFTSIFFFMYLFIEERALLLKVVSLKPHMMWIEPNLCWTWNISLIKQEYAKHFGQMISTHHRQKDWMFLLTVLLHLSVVHKLQHVHFCCLWWSEIQSVCLDLVCFWISRQEHQMWRRFQQFYWFYLFELSETFQLQISTVFHDLHIFQYHRCVMWQNLPLSLTPTHQTHLMKKTRTGSKQIKAVFGFYKWNI